MEFPQTGHETDVSGSKSATSIGDPHTVQLCSGELGSAVIGEGLTMARGHQGRRGRQAGGLVWKVTLSQAGKARVKVRFATPENEMGGWQAQNIPPKDTPLSE